VFLFCRLAPATVAAQTTVVDIPAPTVTVSLDGSREAKLFPGLPMLVKVALLSPEFSETNVVPILLAADAGSWTNALRIQVTTSSGANIIWNLRPFTPPGDLITLSGSGYAELAWWLPPDQSAVLVPGKYNVVARLDTTAVQRADCWHGVAWSVPANIEIELEPAVLSEEESERKQISLAQYAFFTGQREGALSPLNQMLAQYPTNIGCLTLKSALHLEFGQIELARQTYEAALETLFARTPNPPEPPLLLMEIHARIEATSRQHSITSINFAGNFLTLRWETEVDERYQVERSLDLQSWQPFAEKVKATQLTTSFTTNLFEPSSFFRVLRY
jgi:hypothetical protein